VKETHNKKENAAITRTMCTMNLLCPKLKKILQLDFTPYISNTVGNLRKCYGPEDINQVIQKPHVRHDEQKLEFDGFKSSQSV